MRNISKGFCTTLQNPLFISTFSVLLIILGFRWVFVGLFGVNIPFWDQWDTERHLYTSFTNNSLTLNAIFKPHNEHRIVFTKLLSLLTFSINNGWQPLLNMIVQAILPAIAGSFFFYCYIKDFPTKYSNLSVALIILVFTTPMNRENLLWGFQSQFYFLILFALIALRFASNPSWKIHNIILTFFVSVIAAISMGSGFSIAFVCGLAWSYNAIIEQNKRLYWVICALTAFFASYLLSFLTITVPHHDFLKADSFHVFFKALIVYLGWPYKYTGLFLFWLPTAVILFYLIYIKEKLARAQVFSLCIFAWIGIQAFAASYSRGNELLLSGGTVQNRYGDIFILVTLAGLLLSENLAKAINREWIRKAVIIWKLTAILLLIGMSYLSLDKLNTDRLKKKNMQSTIVTSINLEKEKPGTGLTKLKSAKPNVTLAHANAETIWQTITDPKINGFLPLENRIIQPVYSKFPNDTHQRSVFHTVPQSPSGRELGTYIGGDQWTGVIESQPLEIKKDKIVLMMAGYLFPGKLETKIYCSPSGKTLTLNKGPDTGMGLGEKWRKVHVSLPKGTRYIKITLIDKQTSNSGWTAIGGVATYVNNILINNYHITILGVLLIGIAGFILSTGLVNLQQMRTSEQISRTISYIQR